MNLYLYFENTVEHAAIRPNEIHDIDIPIDSRRSSLTLHSQHASEEILFNNYGDRPAILRLSKLAIFGTTASYTHLPHSQG